MMPFMLRLWRGFRFAVCSTCRSTMSRACYFACRRSFSRLRSSPGCSPPTPPRARPAPRCRSAALRRARRRSRRHAASGVLSPVQILENWFHGARRRRSCTALHHARLSAAACVCGTLQLVHAARRGANYRNSHRTCPCSDNCDREACLALHQGTPEGVGHGRAPPPPCPGLMDMLRCSCCPS